MTYSIIGILAAILLVIVNRDILFLQKGRDMSLMQRYYRAFLYGVLAYYITDLLWGILESNHVIGVLYADTVIHFIAMASAVMLWTRYVISYLCSRNRLGKILYYTGMIFLGFEIIALIVNFFVPVQFWFDENGGYHAEIARYITLAIQIILFILTSVYTLVVTFKSEGSKKHRHLTIGLFGIAMTVFIAIQFFYPLLPFYAMGYMLGTCLLHSFVVEDEKEEYRRSLEEAVERERLQTIELTESREALKDALAIAENASKAKSAFLSNMSHEIRTPMNAIIGLNNIAMQEPSASEEVKGYLEKIGGSAQHLLEIINDILDMSRIESGRMTIHNEEFYFAGEIEQVNTIISGQCRDKGLNFDYQVNGMIDDYYVGDSTKLKQVLINILGNAVKFTPEGGKILFTIEEGNRYDGKVTLRFMISDTGIGMSEEFLPHIFDAFSQEDSSMTSQYGSTGLGMSITKSIVELMNGSIDVKSEKGRGSLFTLALTFGESSRKPEEEDRTDSIRGAESDKDDLKGKRILLAEDVDVNAEIIMMLLDMNEMETELAKNGRIAVEKFSSHEPGYYDAVLMDMRMPEMDGLEATRAIRNMDREDGRLIPIIALTANAFDEDVQQSMQAGLDAHLSKPVDPEKLLGTLRRLIRS